MRPVAGLRKVRDALLHREREAARYDVIAAGIAEVRQLVEKVHVGPDDILFFDLGDRVRPEDVTSAQWALRDLPATVVLYANGVKVSVVRQDPD